MTTTKHRKVKHPRHRSLGISEITAAQWTEYLTLALPLIVAALWAWNAPLTRDGDLWLHIGVGKQITASLRAGLGIPNADSFTYSSSGQPAELHSWLGQIALYGVHYVGGEAALRALHTFLVLCIFGVLAWWGMAKGKLGGALTGVCTLFAFLLHREYGDLKPSLFGELLFAVLSLGLLGEAKPLTKARVALVALVVVVWSNFHGSGLLAVPCLALFALALRLSGHKRAAWLSLLLIPLTMATPVGWKTYQNAIELARLGRDLGVGEWSSARLAEWKYSGLSMPFSSVTLVYLLLLSSLPFWYLAFFPKGKKGPAPEVLLSLLLFLFWALFSLFSMRSHVYGIAAVISAGVAFHRGFRIDKWMHGLNKAAKGQVAPVLAGAFLSVIVLSYASAAPYSKEGLALPVKAVDFLVETGVEGNAFNEQTWGGYLIERAYPSVKVAIDSRIKVHGDLVHYLRSTAQATGMVDLGAVLNRLDDTDLIVHRSSVPLREILGNNWIIVFENRVATIAMRRTIRNADNFKRILSYYQKQGIPFDETHGFQIREALQASAKWVKQVEDAYDDGHLPEAWLHTKHILEESDFWMSRQLPSMAAGLLKAALLTDDADEKIMVRLGEVLVASGKWEEAKRWLEFLDTTSIAKADLVNIRVALREAQRALSNSSESAKQEK